jgi:AcrR family transcriptional regulator
MPSQNLDTARTSAGPVRSEAAHQAILDAAEALLNESGPSAVTFEAVARRARAGKPTIYRWWPNKAALLLEIYNRNKQRLVPASDTGSLKQDLTDIMTSLFAYWRETGAGAAFAALVAEAQFSPDVRQALLDYFADEANTPLAPAITRGMARGEVSPHLSVKQIREAVMAVCWFRMLTGQLEADVVPGLVDTLVDGFLPRD